MTARIGKPRRVGFVGAVIFLVGALATPLPALAQPDAWGASYPGIRLPGPDSDVPLRVFVGPNGGGLALHLTWTDSRPARGLPRSIGDTSQIAVTLHVGGETVVAPTDQPRWVGIGSAGTDSYSLIVVFPWQRNAMDEAWFKVTAGGVTYWIELPYGLARDPRQAQLDGPVRGYPRFPRTMAELGERDTLVPWLRVEYQIGEIHDRARLWLQLVNGERPRLETMIHREVPGHAPSAWTLDRPIVSATLQLSRGRSFPGVPSARKLHEDGVRDDEFVLSGDASPEREWGTIVVRVDDRPYSVRVPSSLFKRLHGVTDPGNPRRSPLPEK